MDARTVAGAKTHDCRDEHELCAACNDWTHNGLCDALAEAMDALAAHGYSFHKDGP